MAILNFVPTWEPMLPNMSFMPEFPALAAARLEGLESGLGVFPGEFTPELTLPTLLGEVTGLLASLMAGNGQAPATDTAACPASDTSAAPADASTIGAGSATGQELARAAEAEANKEHSEGWCYRGVGNALRTIGVNTSGNAAYMAADQLAQNPKFREVHVSRSELPQLPAGAVVVWAQGPGHPYGHISVALGDGREASDHIQKQVQDLGGGDSFRVFMPV